MFQMITPINLDPTAILGSTTATLSWGLYTAEVAGIYGTEVGGLAGALVWLTATGYEIANDAGAADYTKQIIGWCFSYTPVIKTAQALNVPQGHLPPAYGMDRAYNMHLAVPNTIAIAKGPGAKYLTTVYAKVTEAGGAFATDYTVGDPLYRSMWAVPTKDPAVGVAGGPIIGYVSAVQILPSGPGSTTYTYALEIEARV